MLALALLLAACGTPDTVGQVGLASPTEPPAALSAPPTTAITASIQALEPRELPDGLGGRVLATQPIALSLGGGWGGRALDPVLVVGQRRFTEYDFPAPGVLRYTLPDRALLGQGPILVRWAPDDQVDLGAVVQEALR